ncbi:tRNA-guanosine(34) transglycosylase [Candidatus Babeliales bacterium]|nr:tRNA-guanosine(34) transglycosylase [Candidatus Babeliales bacterium]MBP9843340.1 tRNA-guanosine(34) transglycosylase [Candidatus Babeliales bacterium]
MSYFSFKVIYQSKKSKARVGQIITPHGIIDTPNFVAVGTNGTLKALDNQMLEQMEQQLMFCNTYHLLLHPGPEVVKAAGGIHKFINRNQPIITDSGGFQVFSLAYGTVKDELKSKGTKSQQNSVAKITEDGVTFRSYRDGAKILLTPEISIQVQKDLGADIIIPFDELPPYHIDEKALKKSLDRTHRWEKRSLDEHLKNPQQQAMYAVIHGGISKDFRSLSCKTLTALPFDGFAIGGSVGKNHGEMIEMLTYTIPQLPEDKPNHLLGIGDLPAISEIIPLGIDTFDSSHPTKCARHGHLFSSQGTVKITQGKYKMNFGPIDPICSCYTCKNYTLSYMHHLFKAHEPVALTLATIHNVAFMVQLMKQYRQDILDGKI